MENHFKGGYVKGGSEGPADGCEDSVGSTVGVFEGALDSLGLWDGWQSKKRGFVNSLVAKVAARVSGEMDLTMTEGANDGLVDAVNDK